MPRIRLPRSLLLAACLAGSAAFAQSLDGGFDGGVFDGGFSDGGVPDGGSPGPDAGTDGGGGTGGGSGGTTLVPTTGPGVEVDNSGSGCSVAGTSPLWAALVVGATLAAWRRARR